MEYDKTENTLTDKQRVWLCSNEVRDYINNGPERLKYDEEHLGSWEMDMIRVWVKEVLQRGWYSPGDKLFLDDLRYNIIKQRKIKLNTKNE